MTTPHLPPTPTYILRGHAAPIHALQIFNKNLRLVSGDADGWIIVWDLIFKRPVAVWKAHEGAVLEVKAFTLGARNLTEIYTHGRDHKLRVWRFRRQDEESLSKTLPVDGNGIQNHSQPQPWLIHSLPVNALNFCAFSMLFLTPNATPQHQPNTPQENEIQPSSALIAVPNALNSGALDIFHLPSERRICTIPTDPAVNTGMVMAAALTRPSGSEDLYVAAAYEDGHVMVFGCRGVFSTSNPLITDEDRGGVGVGGRSKEKWKWTNLYTSRAHSQPVLSIDIPPSGAYILSSSADAILVKHPIPHFGSTSTTTSQPHVHVPLKSLNTKHAGQQGLRIRSDGKIFATAGWDSRVRVYSCKTMKELAVLKWHKEGCYAVAFGFWGGCFTEEGLGVNAEVRSEGEGEGDESGGALIDIHQGEGEFSLAQVQRQRGLKVQNTHWLAGGSKDGKISLWDIY
ncbi:WD40-repeat-containing domain protein [Aspergillus cavernicola]|uniref:ASTRA-associated protein 1 n=1 Tax=Aspergillus cavernicola TaxID=176166 RepID=A0ABR4ITD8_9EURO